MTRAVGQMCRFQLTQRVDEGAMITSSGGEGAAPPDQPVQHGLQSKAPAGAIDLIGDADGPRLLVHDEAAEAGWVVLQTGHEGTSAVRRRDLEAKCMLLRRAGPSCCRAPPRLEAAHGDVPGAGWQPSGLLSSSGMTLKLLEAAEAGWTLMQLCGKSVEAVGQSARCKDVLHQELPTQ